MSEETVVGERPKIVPLPVKDPESAEKSYYAYLQARAKAVGVYYSALRGEGFDERQAIELCQTEFLPE